MEASMSGEGTRKPSGIFPPTPAFPSTHQAVSCERVFLVSKNWVTPAAESQLSQESVFTTIRLSGGPDSTKVGVSPPQLVVSCDRQSITAIRMNGLVPVADFMGYLPVKRVYPLPSTTTILRL